MNIKSILITAGVLVVTAQAAEINPKFFAAIHKVESSGREGNIVGDNGKALGPLQIHRSYFEDAVKFDPTIPKNYNSVTNLAVAKKVVTAYLQRYAPKAVKTNDLQTLARIHNGGPSGHKIRATEKYWAKVEKHLTTK